MDYIDSTFDAQICAHSIVVNAEQEEIPRSSTTTQLNERHHVSRANLRFDAQLVHHGLHGLHVQTTTVEPIPFQHQQSAHASSVHILQQSATVEERSQLSLQISRGVYWQGPQESDIIIHSDPNASLRFSAKQYSHGNDNKG